MLMLRSLLATLGMGALITSFVPVANAQTSVPANPATREFTLSGDSLTTIENRSVTDDYQEFWSDSTENFPQGTNITDPASGKVPARVNITDRVQVVVGETIAPNNTAYPFTPNQTLDDKVKVQVTLDENL